MLKRGMLQRVCVVLTVVLLLVGLATAVGQTTTAYAATNYTNQTAGFQIGYRNNCGTWTCSLYLSRSTTRWIADHSDAGAIADLAMGLVEDPVAEAVVVATLPTILIVGAKSREASGKNQCLRIRYFMINGYVVIVGYYSDGGYYCID